MPTFSSTVALPTGGRRLIRWTELRFDDGKEEPIHDHPREAQIKWVETGVIAVPTPQGYWVAPPGWGVWIPAGIQHGGVYAGQSLNRNLWIIDDCCAALPQDACLVCLSPRLREKLGKATLQSEGYEAPSRAEDEAVVTLISEELQPAQLQPLVLPSEVGKRLAPILAALRLDPADDRSIEDWAAVLRLSVRSLSRMVQADVGMSFSALRARVRLLHALQLLGLGREVAGVSAELGYRSVSAFVHRFKCELGRTPGRYFAERNLET